MGNNRDVLPNRRSGTTLNFEHNGMIYTATFGGGDDKVTELFLNNAHLGSLADSTVRDAAIAVSFALQYGAGVDELRRGMTRDGLGRPSSPLGCILDIICGERDEKVD